MVLLGLLALVLALTSGGGKGSSSLAVGSAAGSGFDGAALPSPLPAPDFTLRDQSGGTVALHSLRGSPVVLAFLYPGCGPSCVLIAEQIRGALDDLPHPVPVVIVERRPLPRLAGRGEALPRRSLAVRAGALPGRAAPAAAGDLARDTGSCRPAPAPPPSPRRRR